jgi:hypothetical protein
MKAIQAEYDGTPDGIKIRNEADPEDWQSVCGRFNDDVRRICDVKDQGEYTALYECCDEKDRVTFYLVQEDASLYRLRRRHFLSNLGREA